MGIAGQNGRIGKRVRTLSCSFIHFKHDGLVSKRSASVRPDVFRVLRALLSQGRAGADGGRGEIGEVGAKVPQNKT